MNDNKTKDSMLNSISSNLRIKDGKCPNGHSLMTSEKKFDGEDALYMSVRVSGRGGTIYLNPFYGRFDYESDLKLAEGEIVELFCPQCNVALEIDTICKLCNIPMFAIHLSDGGQVEACPMIGCHKHSLKIVDMDEQLARMYVDETKVQM